MPKRQRAAIEANGTTEIVTIIERGRRTSQVRDQWGNLKEVSTRKLKLLSADDPRASFKYEG